MVKRSYWVIFSLGLAAGGYGCSGAPTAGDAASGDSGSAGDGANHADGPALNGDAASGTTGTDAALLGDSRAAYCMGSGPPVVVGDGDGGTVQTCTGSIAQQVFRNAVCSCTDADIAGYFQTRSWNSTMGGTPVASGGPVGIDNTDTTGGYTDVGGTFTVTGTAAIQFAGYLKSGGDLMLNGDLGAAGYVTVARDAWVNGNILVLGPMQVTRDLHQSPPHTMLATPATIGGATMSSSAFTLTPPCDCNPADLVDIAGIVANGEMNNDNASVSLDPAALSNVLGIGVDITLPCGRFYVDSIGGVGGITIHVPGRTALFVGGDVNAIGALNVDMGPSGELDLFIAGNLLSIGAGSFGNASRPAATRIYVGSSGDVTLVGASGFVGNVYAPYSRITAPGATTVYGSIFGRLIAMPGYLSVNYDRAILDADQDCPPSSNNPPMCTVCGPAGCPNSQGCSGGTCGPCQSDADCCSPLVCYTATGQCGPLAG